MKNKNGQVLVIFMLMLPLILLFLGFIVDVGLLFIEKRSIENNVKGAIEYRFESNLNENNLYSVVNNLLEKNIDDINHKQINISANYIKITVNKKITGVFPFLFKQKAYDIKVSYKGYINTGKLVIVKE